MAKKKSKTAETKKPEEYTVLIPVTSKAGKDFKPGETITNKDFPAAVIDNWLGIDPPVLEVKKVKDVE